MLPVIKPSVVIYGPQVCGKAINPRRIAVALGYRYITEASDYDPSDAPPCDHLILADGPNHPAIPAGCMRMSFDDAMAFVALYYENMRRFLEEEVRKLEGVRRFLEGEVRNG